MEFKLNELHRNVPDEDLINDIKYVAMNLRVDSISTKQYREFGKHNFCGGKNDLQRKQGIYLSL